MSESCGDRFEAALSARLGTAPSDFKGPSVALHATADRFLTASRHRRSTDNHLDSLYLAFFIAVVCASTTLTLGATFIALH
jgi:hypothetical protein